MRIVIQTLLLIYFCFAGIVGAEGFEGKPLKIASESNVGPFESRIKGRVVEAESGKPMADVSIEIHVPMEMFDATISNSHGDFNLNSPPYGEFILNIRKTGYQDKRIPMTYQIGTSSPILIEMEKRPIRNVIEIKLKPIVMDPEDAPRTIKEVNPPPAVDYSGHLEHEWKKDSFKEVRDKKKVKLK